MASHLPDNENRRINRLEMRNITKRFPGVVANDKVCFDVKAGEVHALLGENGAGKSTLLKILSRVTEPSKGYAEIHGRVGSLLEVGTMKSGSSPVSGL